MWKANILPALIVQITMSSQACFAIEDEKMATGARAPRFTGWQNYTLVEQG
jgi:hypothetical protein